MTFEQDDKDSYGSVIYVSEDVFNKLLMRGGYDAFLSFENEKTISLKDILFKENKTLPENTIITPKPKEVGRLQNERFDNMIVDLENFNSMLEKCR